MADIVVVDDEGDLLTILRTYLEQCGHRVRTAESGQALQRHLGDAKPDLVVLDLGLPGESGLAIARQLREHHDLAIIMLTGAIDPIDRVVGLEIGADDYLTKPCDLAELAARIEAVLRRRKPAATIAPGMLPFGSYSFDTKGFRLLDGAGAEVVLTAMEVDLVAAFADKPGQGAGPRRPDASGAAALGGDLRPQHRSPPHPAPAQAGKAARQAHADQNGPRQRLCLYAGAQLRG